MTVVTRASFPTVEWFRTLQQLMNEDRETFRKLGFVDAKVGIIVAPDEALPDGRNFLLTFGAYTCDDVTEAAAADDVNFSLEAPYSTWKEMIDNIQVNRGADLRHTLNYLHFGQIALKAPDQMQADLFFRVNSSLQAFFDSGASIQTTFLV